jgi:predicted DNA-binding protein
MSKKRKMLEDRVLTLRLPESVYDKVDYIAYQEWRSISSVIREAIRSHLEEKEDLFTEEYYDSIKEKYGATD